jgi:subtilisin family serine protease
MIRIVLRGLLVVAVLLTSAGSARAAGQEQILLKSTGSREQMRKAVEALGGRVTQEFQNVNAIAATVPSGGMAALAAFPEFKVAKDLDVAPPSPRDPAGESTGVVELGAGALVLGEAATGLGTTVPNDYLFNNTLIRADAVQASGNVGDGVVVVIIDTGTANSPTVGSLYGRVIGGQSFIPATVDGLSATSTANSPHGTWVGSVIAGRITPGFSNASCLSQAIRRFAPPTSWIDGAAIAPDYAGYTFVPVRGVAQGAGGKGARLYALKVFAANGTGTASSWILGAMDRAITMKKNFQAGRPSVPVSGDGTAENPFVYDSLDVSVVNMSLGGPSLSPGLDLDDQLMRQFLEVGIVPAISAGNAGPSSLTTGSPSTGVGSISSAAASTATHERIVRSFRPNGACSTNRGALFRPTDHLQTALFSSRGPTPDGRTGVSVTTAGDFNFVQGPDGGYAFVSGTSFAAPTVAGAAALLRAGALSATGTQIRNAIVAGANPRMLGDHPTASDQGAGFLDVTRSLELLKGGRVSRTVSADRGGNDVAENLEELGLRVRELEAGKSFSERTGALVPGERYEIRVATGKDVEALQIDVNGSAALPPEQQNALFGDDLILAVHSAKTTSMGEGDYLAFEFVVGAATYTVGPLDSGVTRVTFLGDWTNVGRAGAEVKVTAIPKRRASFSARGTVADGDWLAIPVVIPAGSTAATFELGWKHDWSHTPTNDIDMYVVGPDGIEVSPYSGATLNAPERVVAEAPAPGTYTVYVNGYTVFGHTHAGAVVPGTDEYQLKVYLE